MLELLHQNYVNAIGINGTNIHFYSSKILQFPIAKKAPTNVSSTNKYRSFYLFSEKQLLSKHFPNIFNF